MYFSLGMGPTSYHFFLKDIPIIYKYHKSLMGLPDRSMARGSFTKQSSNTWLFQVLTRAITCIFGKGIQCVFLTSPLIQHCFTTNEHVQYPGEVSLVPCKNYFTASEPVQYPSVVTHTSLIDSIIFEIIIHPYRYFIYIWKFLLQRLGVWIEVGWYSESFFDLLRVLHFLFKV